MHPSNITVGLTTFNRKSILLNVLKSIYALDKSHDFLVCDDASTEYNDEFLRENFQGWRVYRAESNSGRADFAISRLMDIFLETGKEYLLLLDSDLLIDPDITNFICRNADTTEGIFSVFNTPSHPTLREEGIWLIKPHIGSAGTVFRRDVLSDIRKSVPSTKQYDWDWSNYLTQKNIPIRVSKRSYVQHLGFSNGENASNFTMGDIGVNFYEYTPFHLSVILDEYLIQERNYQRDLIRQLGSRFKELEDKIALMEAQIANPKR